MFPTAPSNFPQFLTVQADSPTSLTVSWQAVPDIDQNGIITHYVVYYRPVQTFDGQLTSMSVTVMAPQTTTRLMDLQEYVEYDVRVLAATIAGDGLNSPIVRNRTLESGKILFHMEVWKYSCRIYNSHTE